MDFLRGLAVVSVLVFHFSRDADTNIFYFLGRYGWMGVDLFFVLSGFLIGGQLFKELLATSTIKINSFYIQRILRTWPNFLIIFAIYYFFPDLREKPTLPETWKFLTFTQNFALDRSQAGAFSHAWSLCVEEQFYLILPLICFFTLKRWSTRFGTTFIGTLFLIGIALRLAVWIYILQPEKTSHENFGSFFDQWIYYPSLTHLDGLLAGLSLALLKIYQPKFWQTLLSKAYLFLFCAFILFCGSLYLSDHKYSPLSVALLYPTAALAFASLLIFFVSPRPYFSYLRWRGVSFLATLSYSLYLIQKLVFHWCQKVFSSYGVELYSYSGFSLCFAICLVFALMLYFFVEKPFLFLREKLKLKTSLSPGEN